MFGIIVLLHNPSALQLEVTNWWPDISSGFFDRVQNSWFHQLWQVVQVLKLQSSPRPSHYHHDCRYDDLFMKCCVGFPSDVTGHTPSKKLNSCRISPQNICPKVLGIIKLFFGKCETSLCVLFGQQWLLPWNSPMDAVFAQSLSYCWIMNTDLNWGLQFFRCCSGFFYDLLDESSLPLGVILVGRPLLGRFTTAPSFLHLWIMALSVVRWSPKALEMALLPLLDWYMSTILFLICSWISLDRSMLCCSLSMLHFVRQVLFKWFLDSTGLAVIRLGCG